MSSTQVEEMLSPFSDGWLLWICPSCSWLTHYLLGSVTRSILLEKHPEHLLQMYFIELYNITILLYIYTTILLFCRYFKYSGALFSVWLVGYFRFSVSWPLMGLFVYMLNKEYQKIRTRKLDFAREAIKDEQGAILARTDELPSWVRLYKLFQLKHVVLSLLTLSVAITHFHNFPFSQ